MSKRGCNLSEEQKRSLIIFMDNDEEFRKGKFTPNFTFKEARLTWTNIANNLNSIPGAQKDWIQWRRAWQDIKKQAKKKRCATKNYMGGTGGGPSIKIVLSQEDENVLQMMDTTVVEGDPQISESIVILEDHDYIRTDKGVMESEMLNSDDILELSANENVPKTHAPTMKVKPRVQEKKTHNHNMAVRRLQESAGISDRMAKVAEEKLQLKKEYFAKKLFMLEGNLEVNKRIATALESIDKSLRKYFDS